ECPRANIFLITKDDVLITPEEHVLHGITRKHILEMAKAKFTVETRKVSVQDMENAAEAFITSTTKNITPVTAINDIIYGSEAGPKTRILQEMWEEMTYEIVEK